MSPMLWGLCGCSVATTFTLGTLTLWQAHCHCECGSCLFVTLAAVLLVGRTRPMMKSPNAPI